MSTTKKTSQEPSLIKWGLKWAASAGIAGIICCVAPAVLFMFGLMGGIYAISFANFFYNEDGSAGTITWILRGLAVVVGIVGIFMYRKKQNQCSMDPKRNKKIYYWSQLLFCPRLRAFLSLEKWSSWYFDKYIVPAQQEEYRQQK